MQSLFFSSALISLLLHSSVQATGFPISYIEWEKACPTEARCWEFRSNVWHVEGESEALNQGHAFHFDGGDQNRLDLIIDPAGEKAELVVELFDLRYHLVDRHLIRTEKNLHRSIDWSGVRRGRYHVFVYFRRGGVQARVSGRLYYGG